MLAEPMEEEAGEEAALAFEANLAEKIPEPDLMALSQDLVRRLENDKEARKKRDEQYAEGLKRSGLDGTAPGGAQFEGASRAVHPMLAESCVDFAASALRELLPPDGPVRTKIEGEQNEEKIEVAERQRSVMAWQMTEQIDEFSGDMEQLLTQLPMGGSQYLKMWRDRALGRAACEFVPVDDVLIPFSAASFRAARRRTHVQRLTTAIVRERADSGQYRDLRVVEASSMLPAQTKSAEASARIEGKTPEVENLDGERIVYEVDCYAEIELDGDEILPYLVSIDEESGRVLSVYRNWDEQDRRRTRLNWIVEFGFIPWRGAYKIGLPHLIGGLSIAATGALRALLDTAHINNAATLLKLKGARFGGQSKQTDITQITEIEGPPGVDDIRKLAMPYPFNPPSPVLFTLLGWLDAAAKGVVTTAEEKISDQAGRTMPVGTTLALIEQGSRVMSSIHARLHRSMQQVLKILARLNRNHLTDEEQIADLGEVLATRRDFQKGLSVVPVSDPNIFSETQRYAQNQVLMQLSADPRVQYDVDQIHRRMLRQMRIPDAEQILPEKKEPTELNAAAENVAMLMSRPVIAFPQQDQLAHLESHVRFVSDPILVGGVGAMNTYPAMLEHLKQHLGFLYMDTVQKIVQASLPDVDSVALLRNPKTSAMVDRLIAGASRLAHAQLRRQLLPLGPIMNQLVTKIQEMQPPMPMDPSQVAMLDVKRNQAKDAEDMQLKKQKEAREGVETAAGIRFEEDDRKAEEEYRAAELALKAQDADRKERELDAEIRDQDLRAANEAAKFALQLKEDSQPGNQVAGV